MNKELLPGNLEPLVGYVDKLHALLAEPESELWEWRDLCDWREALIDCMKELGGITASLLVNIHNCGNCAHHIDDIECDIRGYATPLTWDCDKWLRRAPNND